MIVSDQLKKQIVIEVVALIFLVLVICYALFAIQKSEKNKLSSFDGMVTVLDDSKVKALSVSSDGVGLDSDGLSYTVTNNNKELVKYKIVVVPDVHDDDILEQIRISTDDLYVDDLVNLERSNGGYVVVSNSLKPGYTRIHLIKAWYKIGTDEKVAQTKVNFEYRLVKE